MRILVACEESQAVTIEMRRLGHEAYSCDIQPCSGGHPEWHIQGDALELIKLKWDMIIAHPPCTYLTVTGNRWFNVERYGERAMKRFEERDKAIEFFIAFANADCPRIAIENPIGIMSNRFRRPDQIIQPWQFALSEEEKTEKSTCLWLKGLPPPQSDVYRKARDGLSQVGHARRQRKATDNVVLSHALLACRRTREGRKQDLPRHRPRNGRTMGWEV